MSILYRYTRLSLFLIGFLSTSGCDTNTEDSFKACIEEQRAQCANSIGIEFILVEPGIFTMGTDSSFFYFGPAHVVEITKPFYLGKYEVTPEQWKALGMINYSFSKDFDSQPVSNVSWNDSQLFIDLLIEKEDFAAYRLPWEAEWEYAARAGIKNSRYHWGNVYSEDLAVCSHPVTQEVGKMPPNDWGFYDMLGNVSEWVGDDSDEFAYSNRPSGVKDPKVIIEDSDSKIIRGGFFRTPSSMCFLWSRGWYKNTQRLNLAGFRLAIDLSIRE